MSVVIVLPDPDPAPANATPPPDPADTLPATPTVIATTAALSVALTVRPPGAASGFACEPTVSTVAIVELSIVLTATAAPTLMLAPPLDEILTPNAAEPATANTSEVSDALIAATVVASVRVTSGTFDSVARTVSVIELPEPAPAPLKETPPPLEPVLTDPPPAIVHEWIDAFSVAVIEQRRRAHAARPADLRGDVVGDEVGGG